MTMFMDSIYSNHMFSKKEYFSSYKTMSSPIKIADGKSLKFKGSGYVQLNEGVESL
ncbi:hypothetical protein VP01_371g3 [Puccinia sorghi]|uniref:Retrovirus-related Pol polyprotein from transposon TNT 1-94-like beta-barrel domain-containing protein n=1 Tax=Puccinia sorghi TaxID=27349 RepID=A0A0L6UU13_9BASI|nr:hypothetical protein VP01_371g3 [Puccinia sorghi]